MQIEQVKVKIITSSSQENHGFCLKLMQTESLSTWTLWESVIMYSYICGN